MRLLIADDHDLLRDTLTLFVEREGDISVQTAATFEAARKFAETEPPFDLILLDYNMPGMNGLEGLKRICGLNGNMRVALISGQISRDVVDQAMAAGAAGFVPKTLPARSLLHAIRFMAMGERFVPVDYMGSGPRQENAFVNRFTSREVEVLRGLSAGLANKEIARRMSLSEATVKLYVKTLYRKLGVANRTQAAIAAREAGLE